MKKKYIKPIMDPKSLIGSQSLLIASATFTNTLGDEGTEGYYALSRQSDSFWDDSE